MSEHSTFVGWIPFFHDMGLVLLACLPAGLGAQAVFTTPFDFIRRPLGWLEMLDAEADDHINRTVNAADRMRLLIDDLLAYARVGSDGKELAPVACASTMAHVACPQTRCQSEATCVLRDMWLEVRNAIAAVLETTEGAVKARHARALLRLQALLGDAGEGEE